jgi:hypothetical protein
VTSQIAPSARVPPAGRRRIYLRAYERQS